MDNISPEEILKKKELEGGISYDDPVEVVSNTVTDESNLTGSRETIRKSDPEIVNTPDTSKPVEPLKNVYPEKPEAGQINSFGKAQSTSPSFDSGWKNLPVEILPSKGMFYPSDTKLAIRSAEVREIRHFSTIDDDDRLDIEDKLSYILDRCLRMDFPGEGVVSYMDLKQEDRFFIIMAIRDLTFVRGENSIMLQFDKPCTETQECPHVDGIELRTGVLSSYELDDRILQYYNRETRSFIFDVKKIDKKIEMFIPSIGVTKAISKFVSDMSRKGTNIDEGFLKIAPFLFEEWRDLSSDKISLRMRESDYWTKEEYSLYFELSEKIKLGTELNVKQKCQVCGVGEVTADINFPSGIRSLFVISDIFRELL
jgi:hypothetical protein